MEERLQKILSRAGIASRRGAEKVMAEGRVTVNGTTVRELGSKADAASDDIRVDGVRVRAVREPVYLLLNKPKGVVTTRHDPEGRPTVMQLVPAVAGLFPVGRLDLATEGLILLTNDGEFAQKVSHPSYEVARTYEAKVRDIPDTETLARMRRGVRVDGDLLKVDHVRILEAENNSWIEITLHEGKNHEVRRLMDAVGHPVSKLRRVALGPLGLKGLKPGEFRSLTPIEVRSLLKPQATRPESPRPRPFRGPAIERHEGARQPKRPRTAAPAAPLAPPAASRPTAPASAARRGSYRPAGAPPRSAGAAAAPRSPGAAAPPRPAGAAAPPRPAGAAAPPRPAGAAYRRRAAEARKGRPQGNRGR